MPVSEPAEGRQRRWRPGRPVDLAATWGPLRRGGGDPTWVVNGSSLFRGMSTDLGALTLAVWTRPQTGEVLARAWGDPEAARWALDTLPEMLGESDDLSTFTLRHEILRRTLRSRPGWRIPRTTLVLESLIPAIIEQQVTGAEAFASQRRLIRRFGAPAPGPGAALGLFVPPSPATLISIPSWEWLRMGITPQRSGTVIRVARVADSLTALADVDPQTACRRLRSISGVGLWTVAETAQRALGYADAVSFGDYHVAKNIGWALTGHEVDDAGLAELLEPDRPHRYRIQRLVELAGLSRPRRAPRMSQPTHLPTGPALH